MSYFAMRSVNRIIKIIFLINFDWMNSLSERLVTSAAIITTILSILGKNDTFIASLVICSQEVVERNISTEKSTISGTLGEVTNRLTFTISLERKNCSWRQQRLELQVDQLQLTHRNINDSRKSPEGSRSNSVFITKFLHCFTVEKEFVSSSAL